MGGRNPATTSSFSSLSRLQVAYPAARRFQQRARGRENGTLHGHQLCTSIARHLMSDCAAVPVPEQGASTSTVRFSGQALHAHIAFILDGDTTHIVEAGARQAL